MSLKIVRNEARSEQGKLARKTVSLILTHLRDNPPEHGARLTELGLVEALNVSRTPVRSALERLTELDVVAPAGPRRGYRFVASHAAVTALLEAESSSDEEEELYVAIAESYLKHEVNEQFSEADMARQFGVTRSLLLRTLERMTADRVIERNPGYGWRFAPLLRSVEGHDESYRFRMIVEPAAIVEPGFVLDPKWAARTRRAHEEVSATPPEKLSMVRYFAMNADFHEMLAQCSGNVFLYQAVQQQNQIRRFQNYAWTYGLDRVADACREHLAILDAIESGDREWAAKLMYRHLDLAGRLKPDQSPTTEHMERSA